MYPIANMFTQLRNAQAVRQDRTLVPFSKIKLEIAKILKNNDFIQEVETKTKKEKVNQKSKFYFIDIKLKYDKAGNGAITDIKFLSKPSRRMYTGIKDIKSVKSGFGILILSTPKGILSGKDAKKQKVGGEIIAEIW